MGLSLVVLYKHAVSTEAPQDNTNTDHDRPKKKQHQHHDEPRRTTKKSAKPENRTRIARITALNTDHCTNLAKLVKRNAFNED